MTRRRRAARSPRARVITGLVLVLPVLTIALVGPLLAGSTTEFVGAPFAGRAEMGRFGADALGRDVLNRFLAGGVLTLVIAASATVLGVAAGCLLGMLAALETSRGQLINRAIDAALAFPQYVLVLLFVAMTGASPWVTVVVIALAYTPVVARVIRAASLEVVQRDHVLYARLLGAGRWQLMRQEIVGCVTGPLSVEAGIRLTYAVAIVSALSYLGFGAPPPQADWGAMISENQIGFTIQPWAVMLPVAAIAVLTVGINLVTEGLAASHAGGSHLRRRRSVPGQPASEPSEASFYLAQADHE